MAVRECYMMMKGSNGVGTWDDMWNLIQKIPGRRKPTKEQLQSWWDADEEALTLEKYEEILAKMCEACGQGSADTQIEKVRRLFIQDTFNCIDGNKDAKLTQNELISFFVDMNTPKPIESGEIESLLRVADISTTSDIKREDFVTLMEDYFLEERKDVPLPLILRAARQHQEQRLAAKQKATNNVSRILQRVRGMSSASKRDKSENSPPPPTDSVPASSPRTEMPEGSFADVERHSVPTERDGSSPLLRSADSFSKKTVFGSLLKKTPKEKEQKDDDSAYNSPTHKRSGRNWGAASKRSSTSPHNDELEKLREANAALQEESSGLKHRVQLRETEIEVLKAKLTKAQRAQRASGNMGRRQDADQSTLEHLSLSNDLLLDRNKQLAAELEDALLERDDANSRCAQAEEKLLGLTQQNQSLKQEVDTERSRAKEMIAVRRHQGHEEMKRRADHGKTKAQLKEAELALKAAQDKIEKLEMDKHLLSISNSIAHDSDEPILHGDFDGSDSDDPNPSQVVFLNPPKHVESADSINATLFSTAGPIYYTFPNPIRPSQLVFDVRIISKCTVEYITCRDPDRLRSIAMYIDQGCLHIPASASSFPLDCTRWNTISVSFSWPRYCYSLYLGSIKLASELPFRDANARSLHAFDVYPKEESSVSYANIRFNL